MVGQLLVVATLSLGGSSGRAGRQVVGAAELPVVALDRGPDVSDVVADRRQLGAVLVDTDDHVANLLAESLDLGEGLVHGIPHG